MGSIKSTATTDQLKSGDTLTSPNSQYSLACWYKPEHTPNGANTAEVIEWANAGGLGRLAFQWEGSGGLRQLFHVGGGGSPAAYTANFSGASPNGSWAHFAGRWGLDLPDGTLRTYVEGFLNGDFDCNSVSCPHPDAGASTAIALFHSRYAGVDSPKGSLARVAFWKDLALSDAEMAYLGYGGNPLAIRPSVRSTKLITYQDFGTNNTDTCDNPLTYSVTGTAHDSDAPTIQLATPGTFHRPRSIPGCSHRGGYSPDKHNYEAFLFEASDDTGTDFQLRPVYCVRSNDRVIRDSDSFYDPISGKYLIAGINELSSIAAAGGGESDSFGVYSSTNGNEFTFVQNVDCSAITGPYPQPLHGTRAWKPRFFLDQNGLHVIVGLASTSIVKLYETHPLTPTDLSAAWSTPVQVQVPDAPKYDGTNQFYYDAQVRKLDGYYYLIYTAWANYPTQAPPILYTQIARSRFLTHGYTTFKSGDWGLGTNQQGPSFGRRADGKWIFYLDANGVGMTYSVTNSAGDFETALASGITVPAYVKINGSANNQPNFVMEGATFRPIGFENQTFVDGTDTTEQLIVPAGTTHNRRDFNGVIVQGGLKVTFAIPQSYIGSNTSLTMGFDVNSPQGYIIATGGTGLSVAGGAVVSDTHSWITSQTSTASPDSATFNWDGEPFPAPAPPPAGSSAARSSMIHGMTLTL